jgi:uncharacterized membrane protein (UPF0127 family)
MSKWLAAICMMLTTLTFAYGEANDVQQTLDKITIQINSQKLSVEYANTFEQRAKGLMFRKSLCEDCGMLFNFKPAKQASIWMKNTFIPLDVAFIDSKGVITDIKPLQPHDLTSVSASKVVKYALEMNQGWFAAHDIHVGDELIINP